MSVTQTTEATTDSQRAPMSYIDRLFAGLPMTGMHMLAAALLATFVQPVPEPSLAVPVSAELAAVLGLRPAPELPGYYLITDELIEEIFSSLVPMRWSDVDTSTAHP